MGGVRASSVAFAQDHRVSRPLVTPPTACARSSCFFSRRTRCFAATRAAREEEPPPRRAEDSRRRRRVVRPCTFGRTRATGRVLHARPARRASSGNLDATALYVTLRLRNRSARRSLSVLVARTVLGPERSSHRRTPRSEMGDAAPAGAPKTWGGGRTPPPSCSVRDERTRRPGRLAADDDLSAAAASRVCRAAPDLRALPDILRASLPLPRFLLSRSRLRLRRHAGGHDGRVLRGGPEDL